jgi:LPXTG-site transpeptidase (sortase) family protein
MNQHNQRQISMLDIIWYYKYQLALYIVFISLFSFATLYALNAVPNELVLIDEPETPAVTTSTPTKPVVTTPTTPTTSASTQVLPHNSAPVSTGEQPVRVLIPKIGIDTLVLNPLTTNANVLNDNLLRGAVHYPGSGTLGNGNVFIFGHSTGLKLVNNQAYKTFNNLKTLNPDDLIQVRSNDREYTYKVTSVTLVDSDKELVDFSTNKNMLTISTCNVFGEKQERFVVEAIYVSFKAL